MPHNPVLGSDEAKFFVENPIFVLGRKCRDTDFSVGVPEGHAFGNDSRPESNYALR